MRIPLCEEARFLAVAILGAYLVLNVLLAAIAPLTAGWPILAVTGVTVPPMVLLMVYLIIPLAKRLKGPVAGASRPSFPLPLTIPDETDEGLR